MLRALSSRLFKREDKYDDLKELIDKHGSYESHRKVLYTIALLTVYGPHKKLTFSEIESYSGCSKASISRTVRTFSKWIAKTKEGRKVLLSMDREVAEFVKKYIEEKYNYSSSIRSIRDSIEQGLNIASIES